MSRLPITRLFLLAFVCFMLAGCQFGGSNQGAYSPYDTSGNPPQADIDAAIARARSEPCVFLLRVQGEVVMPDPDGIKLTTSDENGLGVEWTEFTYQNGLEITERKETFTAFNGEKTEKIHQDLFIPGGVQLMQYDRYPDDPGTHIYVIFEVPGCVPDSIPPRQTRATQWMTPPQRMTPPHQMTPPQRMTPPVPTAP